MDATERIDRIMTRLKGLEAIRESWVPVWRELSDYVLPRKGSGSPGIQSAGRRGALDEKIFDSTATHALDLLASSLGGLLTNPALPWFEIRVRDKALETDPEVQDFLGECRTRLTAAFNSETTGFQTYVHELYLDVALFGTAVMYVESDEAGMVRFTTRPLFEVHVSESVSGVVDTVFRRYELTARQAWQEWGGACSEQVRSMLEGRPDEKVEIVHAVFPRADRDPFGVGSGDFPFASVHLETRARHLLAEGGYLEVPYMVPRWSKAPGETYGRGPGLTALSDVRVLNAMSRTALMAAEKMADPPLMVPDDGFLGPVRSGPGGLSYYRAGASDRIEALPVSVDLRAAEAMMQARRDSIRQIFLNDHLAPSDGPGITATEAVIRQNEKMRVLGPVLGRMQTEFLSPLIRRVFRLMLRAGRLPEPPPRIKPGDLVTVYVSPVMRAQKQYEAQALSQTMQYLSPLVMGTDAFGVLDNFETDAIARHAAELFGLPPGALRAPQQVAQVREAKARQRAAAGQAQGLDQLARTAKTLSEVKLDQNSALDLVAGQLLSAAGQRPGAPDKEDPHGPAGR